MQKTKWNDLYPWGTEEIDWECADEEEVLKKVKSNIEKGYDVNMTSPVGDTPIFYAIDYNYPKVVEQLVQNGSDLEKRNAVGDTPLMYAALVGEPEMIETLVKSGADLEARSWFGRTPLFFVAGSGEVDKLKKLIELGAQVNVIDESETTPLMEAAANELYENVELLINAGSNLEAKNQDGNTAFDLAFSKKTKNLIKKAIQFQRKKARQERLEALLKKKEEAIRTPDGRAELRSKIKNKKREAKTYQTRASVAENKIKEAINDLTKTTPARHNLAVRLQELRKEYGIKAISVAKNDFLVKTLRQKVIERF